MAIAETDLKADPAIVKNWVKGWALTRQVPPPVFENGAYRVEVGLPDQTRRYVFSEYSDNVRQHAEAITEPLVFLKICAPPKLVRPKLPSRWQIQSPGFMMLLDGRMRGDIAELPAGYSYQHQVHEHMTLLNIVDSAGEMAATGRIAFPGGLAVYDRISTHESHRRKGLGRLIMKQLELISHGKNVYNAALVATPDGRALYETLGWQLHSLYTTAVIPKPE
ncbi:GNAT family N-acetyltransferase [Phyllobacterium sp. YR531]|uniref:GNAT family N-acetyltransferase n=1 Tax=Phyllobacterium sp. YR531 TaxID=1144343 RepID=UPI00026F5BEA|nr:GNAT family N-acetyltransferase [Phyllobacterium sp. YR531]EJM98762.1 putative acyltransferase [Phyllobacterium sp. YR531]